LTSTASSWVVSATSSELELSVITISSVAVNSSSVLVKSSVDNKSSWSSFKESESVAVTSSVFVSPHTSSLTVSSSIVSIIESDSFELAIWSCNCAKLLSFNDNAKSWSLIICSNSSTLLESSFSKFELANSSFNLLSSALFLLFESEDEPEVLVEFDESESLGGINSIP